jgi:sarcosine oxidase subunit alpha
MRARLGTTRRLVGLRFAPEAQHIPGESCLVLREGAPAGQVTSVGFSPTLGCTIALAYVPAAEAMPGKNVIVKCRDGRLAEVPVTGHAFFDPDNARQEL